MVTVSGFAGPSSGRSQAVEMPAPHGEFVEGALRSQTSAMTANLVVPDATTTKGYYPSLSGVVLAE